MVSAPVFWLLHRGQQGHHLPLLADFCNLHKWFPILDTCYQVEGVPGQPGVIRYASLYPDAFGKTSLSADDHGHHDDQRSIKWVTEKLLAIDLIERCLSYEIVDNNIGFKSYVGTMQVLSVNDRDCASVRSTGHLFVIRLKGGDLKTFYFFVALLSNQWQRR
ncbi:hypothetical protein DVH24_005474 [Malus domestica]|uniref:Uncharacterized protein n=1 Tax=Malus domestica TaxID=3750 RepID=A0A498KKJ8_MALDO|nr:hypothetical protein DVH24_005474 [Malus domestica]